MFRPTLSVGDEVSKLLLTVREAAVALGCGRTYVYELIKRGEIQVVKLDRLTRIPITTLEEFVARRVDDATRECPRPVVSGRATRPGRWPRLAASSGSHASRDQA
jgi:excisionase family DNA binding protein